MCSNFCQDMDDNYRGDLSDILRASGGVISTTTATTTTNGVDGGGFGSSNLLTISQYQNQIKGFYHPFSEDIGTILGNHLDTDVIPTSTTLQGGSGGDGCGGADNTSSSIFSSSMVQILQDSNKTSNNNNCSISCNNNNNNKNVKVPLLGAAASVVKVGNAGFGFMCNNTSCSSPNGGFLDGATTAGVQISSPRNQGGIKRRKIQAKKVVCIPAPAAANSRQTGEVVPSDLWAWRKYGQKPIKGSPYPRGYYRCSSSKGCSARKQVERSRTDPNMLVITYTSEHNHPWPTQRNALAGSTRSSSSSQPSKTSSKPSLLKKEKSNHSASTSSVKEEDDNINKVHQENVDDNNNDGLFNESYRPLIVPDPNIIGHPPDQDFFADLVEFDSDNDPLKLFSATHQGSKELDPFSGLFDWATSNPNTNANATTYEDYNDHTTVSTTSKIS